MLPAEDHERIEHTTESPVSAFVRSSPPEDHLTGHEEVRDFVTVRDVGDVVLRAVCRQVLVLIRCAVTRTGRGPIMLSVDCAKCSTRYRLPERYSGKRIRCKKCDAILAIPEITSARQAPGPRDDQAASQKRRLPGKGGRTRRPGGRTRERPPRPRSDRPAKRTWLRKSHLVYVAAAAVAVLAISVVCLFIARSNREAGEATEAGDRAGQAQVSWKETAPPEEMQLLFDPVKHLDGFEACYDGEYYDIYDFQPFEEKQNKLVKQAELDDLRRRWRQERERVQKEIANPDAKNAHDTKMALRNFERNLINHPFFRKIDYKKVEKLPFVFFVQDPPKEAPNYYGRVVNKFTPWLRELEGIFKASYVEPLKLKRNEEHRFYAIAILATKSYYTDEYATAVREPGPYPSGAHYDPKLRLAVTYEDPFTPLNVDRERRRAILHEFIHALQDAYYSGHGEMPSPIWFTEGLAEYWTRGQADTVEALREPTIDNQQLDAFVRLRSSEEGRIYLNNVKDLVTANGPGYMAVIRRAQQRMRSVLEGAGLAPVAFPDTAIKCFYVQSSLFMHFLHARHKPALMRYVTEVMKGESGWKAFAAAFESAAEALDGDFTSYVENHHPDVQLPTGRQARPAILVRPAAPRATQPARPKAEEEEHKYDPGELKLVAKEWKAQLAVAIHLGRLGRLEEAVARLDQLQRATEDRTASQRVERELGRLKGIVQFRDTFLKEATGRIVKFEIDGEQYRGRLEEESEGVIYLGRDRREIPLAKLDTSNLHEEAKKLKKFKSVRYRWTDAYLRLLNGESQHEVKRYLKAREYDPAKVKELRADLASYEELRALGETAFLVDSLSQNKPPQEEGRRGASAAFDRLQSLLGCHGETELVRKRKSELKSYAEALLAVRFDPTSKECLGINGEMQRLDDGRFRFTYSFKSLAQAKDFMPEAGYLNEWRRFLVNNSELPEIPLTGKSAFVLRGNAFEGVGATCYRHAIPFAAPFRVRYTLSFGRGREGERFLFVLGLCDDGSGHNVRCTQWGELMAFDGQIPEQAMGTGLKLFPGQSFHYEVKHDGNTIEYLAGKSKARLTSPGSLKQGSIFLWIHSNISVRIVELEIEARLDETALGDVKQRWINTRLDQLFRSG